MLSEETLSQAGQKQESISINLCTQTHLTVLRIKKLHQQIVYQNIHKKKNQNRSCLCLPNRVLRRWQLTFF